MKKRLLACLLTLCLVAGMITMLGIGVSAAAPTAEVTVGEVVYPALTLQDAIGTAIVNQNSTVKLLADTEVGALALDGDYTLDLNGKKITVTAPMTLSVGLVTVTDSSAEGTGAIVSESSSCIALTGGSLIVSGGTIHAKTTYAIENRERGELFLTGKPTVTTESSSAIYVGYPNTLHGAYDGKAYEGNALNVSCGFTMSENKVVAKNATFAQFTATNFNAKQFTILEQDGNLIVAKLANFVWIIFAAVVAVAAFLLIFTISHTIYFKRSMKFYSFSFPALFSALMVVTQTQTTAMIVAAAACVVCMITCVALTASQKKALNAAKAKKAEADAKAKIEAEAAKAAAEKAAEEAKIASRAAQEAARAEAAKAAAEEALAEEAPAEEAPAEEAPAKEAPAEEAPAEEAPAEEAPAEEAPAEEAPAEEAPAEEVPAEEVPAEEAPTEEAPTEEAPAEEAPAEEAPAEEAPAEEAPAEEAPAEEAPAEEAPAEEAPAEEAPAEEAPAEEETLEEPTEEAEEEDEEEDSDTEAAPTTPTVATPPKAKADRIVIAETDANGNVIYSAYKKSFTARVIQSPDDVQERYEVLKNALLSYKKVNSRVSWSYDSFKTGKKQLAKFAIRGKSLCLFLALDPSTLEESKYNVANAGDSKKYETVPCRLRLSSKRSIKWGLELIEKLAEQEGLVPNPKYQPKSFRMENETTESLLEKGLIKKIV